MEFKNIDDLLNHFGFTVNHDALIAELVLSCESEVNKHYRQFKNELRQDDLALPQVECPWNNTTVTVQYNPHVDTKAPEITQLTNIGNQAVTCPLYQKF